MSIPKVIGVVFIATAMVNWRRYFGKSPPAVTMYLMVVIIGVLSDIVQLSFFDMFLINELARPILVFISFFVTYNLCINGEITRVMFVLAASSAVFAVLSILGFGEDMGYVYEVGRNLTNVYGEQLERITAFGTNPNGSARVLSLSILFSVLIFFGIVPCKVVWQRLLWLVGGGVSFIVFLQTASRGGAAGLAVGLMAIMLSSRKSGGKFLSYFIAVLSIGLLAFSIAHNELFRHRVEAESDDRSLGGRVVIWTAAMETFREAPVFGQGLFYHAYHIGGKLAKESKSAHNTFLGVLVATGFIGFGFYLLFWLYTLKCAWKIRADKSGVGKVLFVWIAMGMVGALMMGMQSSKWLMVVMAMILGRYKLWTHEQQQLRMLGHMEG
jgi:O-antigen ligase